jgi:hypothetical protein
MNLQKVLRFSISPTLAVLIGLLGMKLQAGDGKGLPSVPFSTYENALVYVINEALKSAEFSFADTFFVPSSQENTVVQKIGPLTLGEALVLNSRESAKVDPMKFSGAITTKLSMNQKPAGNLVIRWHPSAGFLTLAAKAILFRFDRAFGWPKIIVRTFPSLFPETATVVPIAIEWSELEQVMKLKGQEQNLRDLIYVLEKIRIVNPDMNEMKISGTVSYYGDTATNRTIFDFDLKSEFEDAITCSQTIHTDFNPYSKVINHVKPSGVCLGANSENLNLLDLE